MPATVQTATISSVQGLIEKAAMVYLTDYSIVVAAVKAGVSDNQWPHSHRMIAAACVNEFLSSTEISHTFEVNVCCSFIDYSCC